MTFTVSFDIFTRINEFLSLKEVFNTRKINRFFTIQSNEILFIGSINLHDLFYNDEIKLSNIIHLLNPLNDNDKTKKIPTFKSYSIHYEDLCFFKNEKQFYLTKLNWDKQQETKDNNYTKPIYSQLKVAYPPLYKQSYWVPINTFISYQSFKHTFNINLVNEQQIVLINTRSSVFNLYNNTQHKKIIEIVIDRSLNNVFNYHPKNHKHIILNHLFVYIQHHDNYNILQNIKIHQLKTLSIQFDRIDNISLDNIQTNYNFKSLQNLRFISTNTVEYNIQDLIVQILLSNDFPSLLNTYIHFSSLDNTVWVTVMLEILLKKTKNLLYIRIDSLSSLFPILDDLSYHKNKTPFSIIIDLTSLTEIELKIITIEIGYNITCHYNARNIYFKLPQNKTSKNIIYKLQKIMDKSIYTEFNENNQQYFYIKSSNTATKPNKFPSWKVRGQKDRSVTYLEQTNTTIFNTFLSLCHNIDKFRYF